MVLCLRIIREIVQALLRLWNKKDEGNLLENAARTSTASGDGSNGKPALAATGYSSPSQPGVTTGDGAASQSPGTPSRPANVQTSHGRPLNAAGLRAVEHRCLMPTVMGHCGTAKTTPPGHGGAIFRLAKKAPQQEKQLPEIQSRPATSPLADVAT